MILCLLSGDDVTVRMVYIELCRSSFCTGVGSFRARFDRFCSRFEM